MKPSRWLTAMVLATVSIASVVDHAGAASFPTRPIKVVSPFSPGGTNDFLSRIMAQKLTERLGQPAVVENKTGANGIIATEYVAKSAPDGYTIIMGNAGTHGLLPGLRALSYDAEKDFTMLGLIATVPLVLVVPSSFPAQTLKEFIDHARRTKLHITYGSSGLGSSLHVTGELFQQLTGLDMTHVPYRGEGPAVTDVMGGQITCIFAIAPAVTPHIKSGRLKPLAQTGVKRASALPDVPTMAEAGVPGIEISSWFGLMGPANLPKDVTALLSREITQIVQMPDIVEKIRGQGADPMPLDSREFAVFVRNEIAKFGKITKSANIRLD
jgi:tripartite-type tricarboxylate transporter receptor subunit TctC